MESNPTNKGDMMEEFAKSGSVVIRLEEAISYAGYDYHKGKIISMGTLGHLMNTNSEVKVSIILIQ